MEPKNLEKANELYEEREQLIQMRAFIFKRPPSSIEFSALDVTKECHESKEVISEKLVPYIEKAICERLADIVKEVEAL